MSWSRAPVAAALVDVLTTAIDGTVTVFAEPPQTLNPPAIVVGPATMTYAVAGFAVDDVELTVMVIVPVGRLNDLDALARKVHDAILADSTLAGSVKVAWPIEQRNSRGVVIAGIDLSVVDVVVRITT
jgi:hypothetical protein